MKKLTLNLFTLSCVTALVGCASDQHIVVHNANPKPVKVSTAGNTTNIEIPDSSENPKAITDTTTNSSDDAWSWLTPKNNKKTSNTDQANDDEEKPSDDEDKASVGDNDAKQSSDDLWAEIFGRRGDKSNEDSEESDTEDDDWGDDDEEESTPVANKNTKPNPTNNKPNTNSENNTSNDTATTNQLTKAQKEIAELKAKLTAVEKKLTEVGEQGNTQSDELAKAQKEIAALKAKLAQAESKQPKPAKESEFFTTLKQGNAFELDGKGKMAGKMKTAHADGSEAFNGVVLTIDNLESESEGEVVLSIEEGVKNGRSATDSLTTFKLDDDIEVHLTDLADNQIRALRASDFSQGVFSGVGFVGGNSTKNEQQSSIRYGVYTVDDKSILFVNGKPAEHAFEGKYVGNAIYGKDGKYNMLKDAVTAIVSLTDRQSQTGKIDVAINVGGGEILNFGGDVLGNTFEGNRGDAETKGGFYGDGSDMAGVFHVTKEGSQKGYNGVFGGSHQ